MAIYFISDLHLDVARPAVSAAFFNYLENLPADAEHLYILGDFFEVWIGDDDDDPFHNEVSAALARATKAGAAISLLHGNRDFLLGETFARRTGTCLLPDPFLLDYHGKPYLLMHGDSLCTADTRYMEFRQMVRGPAWQQVFLQKSLPERRAIARSLRENSQKEGAQKSEYITDVTPQEVVREMQKAAVDTFVDTLIHGHTHRPAIHHVDIEGRACLRFVLGDWDQYGFDIRLDTDGPQLRRFALDNIHAKVPFGA